MKNPKPFSKLKHYTEFLGVKALSSAHPEVKKLKYKNPNHSAHGNKNWRSSFVLMDYLKDNPPSFNDKVLEIGCGWGLISIFISTYFASDTHSADIDPSVRPFFSLQSNINNANTRICIRDFTKFKIEELSKYSLIVGSDICFWDEMTLPVVKFIKRSLKTHVKRIIIADPGRPPFWNLVDECHKLGGEVFSRRIYKPWKTEKHILVINNEK